LANAKALRPFAEKIITLAKGAASENEPAKKVHFRRQAIRRVRSKEAVTKLFNERVNEFLNRPGGYTRIYKLVPRKTDAAFMALIELINADDSGYVTRKNKKKASKRGMPSPRAKEGTKDTLSPVSKEEKGA
jgi:large subunit ribosomal protein L17